MAIETDQELFAAIANTQRANQSSERSLQDYLLALLPGLKEFRDQEGLSADSFSELLATAFSSEPSTFDEKWTRQKPFHEVGQTHDEVEQQLISQIVDLHYMEKSGQLKDGYKYFGLKSPRGSYWYNFDPSTYIECGLAGAFGSRDFYIGETMTVGLHGNVTYGYQERPEREAQPMKWLTWKDIGLFVVMGQMYE